MLHTIVPIEFIFQHTQTDSIEQSTEEFEWKGVLMEVKNVDHGKKQIVRLINASLEHYLSDEFSPGSIINLSK